MPPNQQQHQSIEETTHIHQLTKITKPLQTVIKCLTLYRMVMPIGTPFLKEKINN